MEKVSQYFTDNSEYEIGDGVSEMGQCWRAIGGGRVTDPPLRFGGQDQDGTIGAGDDGFGDGD
jgi:hypothetical protein